MRAAAEVLLSVSCEEEEEGGGEELVHVLSNGGGGRKHAVSDGGNQVGLLRKSAPSGPPH